MEKDINIDYNHHGHRIKGIPIPVADDEVAPKSYVDSKISISVPGPQGPAGPQGPQGPTGPSGGGSIGNYTHHQDVPASIWTINHPLGYIPGGITVIDSAGSICFGNILTLTTTQVIIDFGASFGGLAYLS